MPQLTISQDVANRRVTANHASAGTQVYGDNHANQRAQTTRYGSVRNRNTVTDYLYGLGPEGSQIVPERLMEFQETCTGGACTSYTETQRWNDVAGTKMFQKTGTTLKAITPNRLASEAKHFPYGETDGPPPADTKDYFATYRRDTTGLDYAWNRYYSPTMGRFTSADPYSGSINPTNPQSWNRFSYTENNPVNPIDSKGLACSVGQADVFVEDLWNDGRTYRFDYLGFICYGPGTQEGQSGSNSNQPVPGLGPRDPFEGWYDLRIAESERGRAIHLLLEKIRTMKISPDCEKYLNTLGTSRANLQAHVPNVRVIDSSGGNTPYAELYRYSSQLYGAAQATYGNTTIYDQMNVSAGPNQITRAASTLHGNEIFINDQHWAWSGSKSGSNLATFMHEMMHNLTGAVDQVLEDALRRGGLVATGRGLSPNIVTAGFQKWCN
jgi:RHS repeat-associated protein